MVMVNYMNRKISIQRLGIALIIFLLCSTAIVCAATDTYEYTFRKALHIVFVEDGRGLELLKGFRNVAVFSLIIIILGLFFAFLEFLCMYMGNRVITGILVEINRIVFLLPEMISILIIYYGVFGGDPKYGLIGAGIAFVVFFGTWMAPIFYDIINDISIGEKEAAYTMGYSKWQALFKIYIPQSLSKMIASLEGNVIIIIKTTALIEIVNVETVESVANAIRENTHVQIWPYAVSGMTYIILAGSLAWLVRFLSRKLAKLDNDPDKVRNRILKGRIK